MYRNNTNNSKNKQTDNNDNNKDNEAKQNNNIFSWETNCNIQIYCVIHTY